MVNWILIALAPIVILVLIEEAAQFFWKRHINGPREKKEGKLKDRLVMTYQNLLTSMKQIKFSKLFNKSKMVTILRDSKLVSFFKRHRKDPSH